MKHHHYIVGKTPFTLELPASMPKPENLDLFEVSQETAESAQAQFEGPMQSYHMEFSQNLSDIYQDIMAQNTFTQTIQRENMTVHIHHGLECRLIRFHGAPTPYAISMETSATQTQIWVDTDVTSMLHYDTVFVALLNLEKLMIRHDAIILHSAYMYRDGQAILFSAPSETGKSTQANLWEKYRGTHTINGDRSLLIRESDGWYAYGWPICGSSEICINEAYPIRAIVMLFQAKENTCQPLKGFPFIQKVLSQITINMWNPDFQLKAMDLIEQLASEVDTFQQGCDISEQAVACLERML